MLPFTAQKQNAVIAGVANTLGEGVLASDISLAVIQDQPHVRHTLPYPTLPLLCALQETLASGLMQ